MARRTPPVPFEPQDWILEAKTELFRVVENRPGRSVTSFNPGICGPTRFAFFGSPAVPVLYAAQSEEAAVCETILHDVPPGPGTVLYDNVKGRVCTQLAPTRDVRLAAFMGDGLRTLGTEAKYVTATMASQYPRTVLWSQAAHEAGYDGVVWMSHRRDTDRAYVFFGDRVAPTDMVQVPGLAHPFAAGPGFDWLADYLASLKLEILMT
ncbi:RES family NAD+ phosphorylase [Arthrobacter sp.]|uniref:RES family NAD+ phosphorylase n=1 Tax=Arthrobacter sp. TaxID=1667 RepID=UPI003A8CB08F